MGAELAKERVKICCKEMDETQREEGTPFRYDSKSDAIDITYDYGYGGLMRNVKFCPFCGKGLEIE
jgi:hypothetical protein